MSATQRVRSSQSVFRAEQHHAALTSTRATLQRYLGGDPALLAQARSARYYDTTVEPTRLEILSLIADARSAFERLPDKIRSRFETVRQLERFLQNPANREEAVKLGLLKPVEKPAEATPAEKLLSDIRDRLPEVHDESTPKKGTRDTR